MELNIDLKEALTFIEGYRRDNPDDEPITNEEAMILMLAAGNHQKLLSKCRWVVIEKLIGEGYLIELDGGLIKPRSGQWDVKSESTNRI